MVDLFFDYIYPKKDLLKEPLLALATILGTLGIVIKLEIWITNIVNRMIVPWEQFIVSNNPGSQQQVQNFLGNENAKQWCIKTDSKIIQWGLVSTLFLLYLSFEFPDICNKPVEQVKNDTIYLFIIYTTIISITIMVAIIVSEYLFLPYIKLFIRYNNDRKM